MDNLSNIHANVKDPLGKLLEPQEKLILEQIASGGPPHSQRAQSLLAIDAGVTQKKAALQSGQTVGQVSYWLSKFRRDRMGIFPEELLRQTGYELPAPPQLPGQLTRSEGWEIDQQVEGDVSEEDSVSPAAGAKSGKKAKTKVKSKKGKDSKKKKKKGKKKGKKKQAKKSNKKKDKKEKKKKGKKKS